MLHCAHTVTRPCATSRSGSENVGTDRRFAVQSGYYKLRKYVHRRGLLGIFRRLESDRGVDEAATSTVESRKESDRDRFSRYLLILSNLRKLHDYWHPRALAPLSAHSPVDLPWAPARLYNLCGPPALNGGRHFLPFYLIISISMVSVSFTAWFHSFCGAA